MSDPRWHFVSGGLHKYADWLAHALLRSWRLTVHLPSPDKSFKPNLPPASFEGQAAMASSVLHRPAAGRFNSGVGRRPDDPGCSSILFLSVCASAACAEKDSSTFTFLEGNTCGSSQHDLDAPDRIHLSQAPNLEVDVSTSLNCAAKAGDPSLHERSGKIILGVREVFTPDPDGNDVAAACNCSRDFRFTLARAVPRGTIVEFQVDGRTTATTSAP